jgi:hypothetical protein
MLKIIEVKERNIVKEYPTSFCVCEACDAMKPDDVFHTSLGLEEVELLKTLRTIKNNLGLTEELMDLLWIKIEEFGQMKEYLGKNS